MDVDEFADAHSANIKKTFNTTHSDSIDKTRVLANPASSSAIIILLILSTVKCVKNFARLSFGSYKTNDGFDVYAQTEYPFESKQAQQDIALKMRLEYSPQTKFSIASFSLLCLTPVIVTSLAII